MAQRELALRLSDRFTHLVTTPETTVLVGDDDSLLLDTPIAAEVVRLLDGRRTAIQIAERLEERHRPEVIHFILLSLQQGEIVQPVDVHDGASAEPTFDEPEVAAFRERVAEAWGRRNNTSAVEVEWAGSGGSSVTLIMTDDYLSADVVELAQTAGPAVLACLGRRQVWLGPHLVPGTNACVSCLQDRLRLNLSARTLLHLSGDEGPDGLRVERLRHEVPAAVFQRLAVAVHDEDLDVANGGLMGALRVFSLDDESVAAHVVHRLPQCEECGDPNLAPPGANIRLRSRRKIPGLGGGFRQSPPDETLDRLAPLISPLTGVVRRVTQVPVDGSNLVHVYTASHARHYGAATIASLKGDSRDPSGGKGRTDLDARVSAVCESLERFSSVHRGREPYRVARGSELDATAVRPNEILQFSSDQFRSRDAWNQADPGGFQWVPDPYEDQTIEWSSAYSIGTGTTRFVPSACVYFGFKGEGRRFARGDSNGLAGGNCLEEAILQGFLELVERDAIALWWYNRVPRPALDLESSSDPYVEELLGYYLTIGRGLWALDLTTDFGIPCFVALSALEDAAQEDIIFGFGAHLDPDIALSRALTEVNQMLPTVFRSREERQRQLLPDFEDAIRWWDTAVLHEHRYLQASEDSCRSLSDYPKPQTTDLRDDVVDCVGRAAGAGCDVLVHDLTRPDVDFAVARVLVPGLRHFWRRLGPGRLYDVPVQLGWMERSLAEDEMNPISMFV